jgi:hypothetical protein
MNWKDLKKAVGGVAPALGAALGGPFGGMAGKFLSDALGVENDPKKVHDALQADPEALAQVMVAQTNYEKRLAELGVEEERIREAGIDSARKREIALDDKLVPVIGSIVLLGFFALVGSIFAGWVELTPETSVLIGALVGHASSKADQVVTYYFGSSRGSKQKNSIIDKLKGGGNQ